MKKAEYPHTGREYGWYTSYRMPGGAVIETYRGLDDLYFGQGDTVHCRLVKGGFVLWEDETCPCHNGCGNKFDLADWVYSNGGADI